MFKFRQYCIVFLIGITASVSSIAATIPEVTSIKPPKNILFIGNSYTYYNNSLHNALRNLIRSSDLDARYPGRLKAMTISGAKLADHAPAIKAIVEAEKWDAVVLQGNSMEAIDKDSIRLFQRAIRSFDEVIDESGAETVLFMTWASDDDPAHTTSLNRSYTLIGNHVKALVVPVGLAFEKANQEYPGIDLRRSDKKHPTTAGTYLAACVFFSALYQKSPEGLAFPTSTTLNETKAANLQKVAWDTVHEYYGQQDQ